MAQCQHCKSKATVHVTEYKRMAGSVAALRYHYCRYCASTHGAIKLQAMRPRKA